jgi:hypothetical protein
MRMFGSAGNPRAENLIAMVAALRQECRLSLTVHVVPPRRRTARALEDATGWRYWAGVFEPDLIPVAGRFDGAMKNRYFGAEIFAWPMHNGWHDRGKHVADNMVSRIRPHDFAFRKLWFTPTIVSGMWVSASRVVRCRRAETSRTIIGQSAADSMYFNGAEVGVSRSAAFSRPRSHSWRRSV